MLGANHREIYLILVAGNYGHRCAAVDGAYDRGHPRDDKVGVAAGKNRDHQSAAAGDGDAVNAQSFVFEETRLLCDHDRELRADIRRH